MSDPTSAWIRLYQQGGAPLVLCTGLISFAVGIFVGLAVCSEEPPPEPNSLNSTVEWVKCKQRVSGVRQSADAPPRPDGVPKGEPDHLEGWRKFVEISEQRSSRLFG
ncbi:hypothetical protein EJ05DRAFT_502603 [Pseudovirgaria hyperparasitica]|uniref:Uncharacterized protein n=1 Tax=Pseudovirgaria hyperparasitica TaxID=470096 RepID=A0A6A6W3H1_9PEZI|nr:uncharacterized protein EJ05DRAFT_502603 [Pseudovirgaria hyperparasitica]KAF2756137.1 hypothetical protein EJ05DRAFT_502603 [Pseudovirgaria hyperparasitica]